MKNFIGIIFIIFFTYNGVKLIEQKSGSFEPADLFMAVVFFLPLAIVIIVLISMISKKSLITK